MSNFLSKWGKILGMSKSTKRQATKAGRRIQIEALEDRVLLDAAGINSNPVLDLSALNYDEESGCYTVDITSGAPYQVAMSATDADGDDIYFRVEPENTNILSAAVSSGKKENVVADCNPYWKITVSWTDADGTTQTGTMVFELFQKSAPDAVTRIIEATNDGFYDNTLFDCLYDGSMIYGGTFTTSEEYVAEDYTTIDDNFNASLQHTTKGLLGYFPLSTELAGNDTGTVQFYITDGKVPSVNYNLSIFGNLIDGYDVLDSISSLETSDHTVTIGEKSYTFSNWPNNPVTILDAEIIKGAAYDVSASGETTVGTTVTLKSTLSVTTETAYSTYMTVTAVDSEGNKSESVKVKVNIAKADDTDSPPYITSLNASQISIQLAQSGQTAAYHIGLINAKDVDGDTVYYWTGLYKQGSSDLLTGYYAYNETSGYYEIYTQNSSTAEYLEPGVYNFYVVVASGTEDEDWNNGDSQQIPVYILPVKPTSVELSDFNYEEGEPEGTVSKRTGLQFDVTGVTKGCTTEIWTQINGVDTCIGSAVCTSSDGTVTVTMDENLALDYGTHDITVKQVLTTDVSVGNTRISDKRLEGETLTGYTIEIKDKEDASAPTILDPMFSTSSWEGGKTCLLDDGVAQAFEDEQLSIFLRAVDPDEGDVVTWTIQSAPEEIADYLQISETDPDGAATITWMPGEDFGGNEYTIVVCASDGRGKSSTMEITINVNETQADPEFYQTNNQAGTAGQWLQFNLQAHDPDATNAIITFATPTVPSELVTDWYYKTTNIYDDTGDTYLYTQLEFLIKIPEDAQVGDNYTVTFDASKTVSGLKMTSTKEIDIQIISSETWKSLVDSSKTTKLEFVPGSGLDVDDVWLTTNDNCDSTKTLSFLGKNLNAGQSVSLFADGEILGVETDVVVAQRVVTSSYGWTLSNGEHEITISQPIEVTITTEQGDETFDIMNTMSNALMIDVDTKAPVLAEALSNNALTEGVQFTSTASATDAHDFTYSLVDAPEGMTIDSQTGEINWLPDFSTGVLESITVKVADELGNYSTKTYAVTAVEGPELEIEDQTIPEMETWTYELNPQNVTEYKLVSAPEGLTLNAPKTEDGKWYLEWTPTEEQGGAEPYQCSISVSNAAGATRVVTFNITVTENNQVPVLEKIENQSVKEGETLNLTVKATDNDLPAQTLTWSLSNAPDGMTITSTDTNGQAIISWTPTEEQGGNSYTVTVSVSDGIDTTSQDVVFTAKEEDFAPEFETPTLPLYYSGKPGTITTQNKVVITFTATDPDIPANDIIYSLVGMDTYGATIDSKTGDFNWNPADMEAGEYVFTVRATEDSENASFTDYSITLTIIDAIDITSTPSQDVIEHLCWTYSPESNADDTSWRNVTWSIENKPDGMTFDSQTGTMSWTPSETQGGQTFTFTLKATDVASSTSQTITLTVEEEDTAPVFETPTLPADYSTKPGSFLRGKDVSIQFVATDPDIPANTVSYSMVGTELYGATIDAQTGVFTWSPEADVEAGEYSFTVRATENSEAGMYSEYSVTLTLIDPIEIDKIEPISATEEKPVSVTPTTNVENSQWRTLQWTVTDAPAGLTVNASTGQITWTPSELQGGSEYEFTLTVTDGVSTDSQTVKISVTENDKPPVFLPNMLPGGNYVKPGSTLTIDFKAYDPDVPTNQIEYTIISAPDGTTIDTQTGVVTWAVDRDVKPGTYPITVRATEIIKSGEDTKSGLYTDYTLKLIVISKQIPVIDVHRSPYDRGHISQRGIELSHELVIDIAYNLQQIHKNVWNSIQNIKPDSIFGFQIGKSYHSLGELQPTQDKDGDKNEEKRSDKEERSPKSQMPQQKLPQNGNSKINKPHSDKQHR